MEGTGWNIVWAAPLAPDQDMFPGEEITGMLPLRSTVTHDRCQATSFFPSLQADIEAILAPRLVENLLLRAHRAVQQREEARGRYYRAFFGYIKRFPGWSGGGYGWWTEFFSRTDAHSG